MGEHARRHPWRRGGHRRASGLDLAGIDIDTTIFRPATFIEVALGNLTNALLLGCLFVLVGGLYDWRTAIVSLVAIPLSLAAAAIVLQLRGTTINVMVLAGFVISVGVVVDDAIIDIENIATAATAPPRGK